MKILHFSSTLSSFIKYFVIYFSTTLYYTLIYKGNVPKKTTEIVKRLQKLSKNNNKHILHITQYTQIYCLYSTSRLVVIHMYKGKG